MKQRLIPEKQLFPALTGWRFPLALWVLFYHLNATLYDLFHPPIWVMGILQHGYYAVDIFFLISGLVISHHYGDRLKNWQRQDYCHFLWLRLARLYPLHLAILLGLAGMVLLAPALHYNINRYQDYSLPLFVANLFLVQAWTFPDQLDWNHPAWSISAEWFAYLISPVLFRMLWRPLPRAIYLVIAIAALSIPVVTQLITNYRGTYALLRVFGGFTAGICLYRMLPVDWRFIRKRHVLTSPAWLYLTQISYAFYMVQFPILIAMRKFWPHQAVMQDGLIMRIMYMTILVTLVSCTAILCYHLIEEPARRYLRQRDPFKR